MNNVDRSELMIEQLCDGGQWEHARSVAREADLALSFMVQLQQLLPSAWG